MAVESLGVSRLSTISKASKTVLAIIGLIHASIEKSTPGPKSRSGLSDTTAPPGAEVMLRPKPTSDEATATLPVTVPLWPPSTTTALLRKGHQATSTDETGAQLAGGVPA